MITHHFELLILHITRHEGGERIISKTARKADTARLSLPYPIGH